MSFAWGDGFISAGDAPAVAPKNLTGEDGEYFYDFDVPGDAEELFGSLVDSS